MNWQRVGYWTPRILGLLFAAFISIFALDVFQEGRGAWETTVALLMHLIPTALVLAVLAVAWRWEGLGAAGFLLLGCAYLMMGGGRVHWTAHLLIAGPLLLLGALFLAHWIAGTRARHS